MFEFPSPGLAECWCTAHGFGCCVRNLQHCPQPCWKRGLQRKLYFRDKQAFSSSLMYFPHGIYQPEFEGGAVSGDY